MGAVPGLAVGVFWLVVEVAGQGVCPLDLLMVWLLNLQMFSGLEVEWT